MLKPTHESLLSVSRTNGTTKGPKSTEMLCTHGKETSCVDHDYINGFCHADTTLAHGFKLIKNFNIFPFFLMGYILFRFRCITDRLDFANTC